LCLSKFATANRLRAVHNKNKVFSERLLALVTRGDARMQMRENGHQPSRTDTGGKTYFDELQRKQIGDEITMFIELSKGLSVRH